MYNPYPFSYHMLLAYRVLNEYCLSIETYLLKGTLHMEKGGKKMTQDMYGLCCRYNGKVVKINERNGRVHHGRITRVSRSHVYIQPVGGRGPGGLGYWGWGPGWGWGAGYGVALGAITGIALAGLFLW